MRRSLATLSVAAVALMGLSSGCAVVNRIAGSATVDLSHAELRRMNVSLRKQEQTFCPREQVQLGIFISAVPEPGKEERTYETYVGRGWVNKNDRLDFASFGFQPEQAQIDADGWLAPIQTIQSTAGHELSVRVTYNPSPTNFSNVYKWKPDYACITSASIVGPDGTPGSVGKDASPARPGQLGGVMSAAGDGPDGTLGGPGSDGAAGGAGPKVRAVVSYVKTPFYDKLIAIRLTGAITDFVLVHPGRSYVLHSVGGKGGMGGAGGRGGAGGSGGSGNPGGHGGNGGAGGAGGPGGVGGAGGSVEVVYDARSPDLAAAVTLDVSGGAGGAGGKGGDGGDAGQGGKGTSPPNNPAAAPNGIRGHEGNNGQPGGVGRQGANGAASVHAGEVGDAFAGLADITVISGGGPARPHAGH